MQHRLHQPVKKTFLNFFPEGFLIHKVGNLAVEQIFELIRFGQIIHRDDVALTAFIQRFDEIRTDKTSRSSDDVIHI